MRRRGSSRWRPTSSGGRRPRNTCLTPTKAAPRRGRCGQSSTPTSSPATSATWVAALRGRADCTGKVGVMGFCLGGKNAYLASMRLPIEAAVSYYGVQIDQHLDEADRRTCPILMHFAENDPHVPAPTAAAIQARMGGSPGVQHPRLSGAPSTASTARDTHPTTRRRRRRRESARWRNSAGCCHEPGPVLASAGCSTGHAVELRGGRAAWPTSTGAWLNISSFGSISSGRSRLPSITKTTPGKLSRFAGEQPGTAIRAEVAVEPFAGLAIATRFWIAADQWEVVLAARRRMWPSRHRRLSCSPGNGSWRQNPGQCRTRTSPHRRRIQPCTVMPSPLHRVSTFVIRALGATCRSVHKNSMA